MACLGLLLLIMINTSFIGVPLITVLEVFGEHFLAYCYNNGYDKMLQTLGKDFVTFMQNLDSLHALLSFTYKNFDAPSFRWAPWALKNKHNHFSHSVY